MSDDFRVTLRVGAMLDGRSVDATLGAFEQKSQRAAQNAGAAFARAERARGALARTASNEQVTAQRAAEREIAAIQRKQVQDGKRAINDIRRERQDAQREATKLQKEEARNAAQIKRQMAADDRRYYQETQRLARQSQSEQDRFAQRTSHRATRFLTGGDGLGGMARYGARVGHDLMRGMGMDWTMSAGLQRNRENETLASQISNQGWVPGEGGKFEDRISKGDVRKNSQTIAEKYAFSENEVSAGTQAYINLTGDLKGALPLMDQLALLSRATGTSMEDSATAAADMSVQFEGMPDKSKRVADMLGIAAMQGKTGALELFQIAKQMPRIVSQTGFFAGDKSVAMGNLLAATQITRRYGGAGSPAQAATVVQGVVSALEKGGGKFVDSSGKNFARDKQGNLLALPEIIARSINVSYNKSGKFDSAKFFDMWNAIRGGKLAMGAKTLYDKAGGGEAGVAAVIAEFKKFTKGLNPEDQKKLAGAAVDNQERRAQRFQLQLDKVAQNLQAELLPVLERLEPKIKGLVEGFAFAIEFVSNNLGSAITLAIVGAIARAGIESGFRMGIERMIGASSPGMTSWQGGFKTFGGSLMTATQLLGAFALAMGATTALLELYDAHEAKKAVKEAGSLDELDKSYQVGTKAIDARTDLTPEQKKEEKKKLAEQGEKRLRWIEKENGSDEPWLPPWLQDQNHLKNVGIEQETHKQFAEAGATVKGPDKNASVPDQYRVGEMVQAFITALSSTVQQTRITNPEDIKAAPGSNMAPPAADRGNSGTRHPEMS